MSNPQTRRLNPRFDDFSALIGRHSALRSTVERARVLTQVDAPVLLQGETGVGKEVFARAIHETGRQRGGPFVALNCGGLPRELFASELFGYVDGAFTGARRGGMIGKLEAANGGTLFLDEIAEMPLDLQPYLLRALESGEIYPLGSPKPRTVKFRLLAACNRDLQAEVMAGRFRMDLFYRISVMPLEIPALRARREDIPALVEHLTQGATKRHGLKEKSFAPEVLSAFVIYGWPGNIRELRNVIETMMLVTPGEVVDASALPRALAELAQSDSPGQEVRAPGLEGVEHEAIHGAIRTHGGNLSRAAKALRISKSTLYVKMKKYRLMPAVALARRAASPSCQCRQREAERRPAVLVRRGR